MNPICGSVFQRFDSIIPIRPVEQLKVNPAIYEALSSKYALMWVVVDRLTTDNVDAVVCEIVYSVLN